MDERAEMNCTVPGVTPDGGPVEGTPVLEPLEHSVLEKSSNDKPMEEAPVSVSHKLTQTHHTPHTPHACTHSCTHTHIPHRHTHTVMRSPI